MKTLLIFTLLVAQTLLMSAQTKEEVLTGKIQKKKWSKSTESYCAQGSDYFVLLYQGKL